MHARHMAAEQARGATPQAGGYQLVSDSVDQGVRAR
jgi:hypothetical protein